MLNYNSCDINVGHYNVENSRFIVIQYCVSWYAELQQLLYKCRSLNRALSLISSHMDESHAKMIMTNLRQKTYCAWFPENLKSSYRFCKL